MNYTEIIEHLISEGFDAKCGKYKNTDCLQVDFDINGDTYTLKHLYVDEISSLPSFFLDDTHEKEGLAHILPFSTIPGAGICVTVDDAVSVNFEVPKLAFTESLIRHISLVEKSISDPDWNKAELVREFAANWSLICETKGLDFVCAATQTNLQQLQIKSNVTGKTFGFEGSTIGISDDANKLGKYSYIKSQFEKDKRKRSGTGLIIPLGDLPIPPKSSPEVGNWYLRAIGQLDQDEKESIRSALKGTREKTFWLVFNGNTGSGTAWFGIKLSTDSKKFLPLDKETVASWNVTPIKVRVFNPESMLPRGGANQSLMNKRVLLVGCGSVGGELAYKLAASGIGELHLSDPDIYSWDNVYRHVLSDYFVGSYKSLSLSIELESSYPWLKTNCDKKKLLEYRDEELLNKFDLIIIAIGSPTHERIFADYLGSVSNKPAVVNTWLEGYGVGGHATLSVPNKKGCLLCAFVDNNDFSRGLSSNLSFIEPNQNLTTNIAGCGDLFLPFSSIDAGQTATIAADLSVKYLLGRMAESCAVSWKGDDFEASQNDISLTHRFYHFDQSLVKTPLRHEGCNQCE